MQTERRIDPPFGIFQGTNVMTQEFVEYRRGTLGGRTVYIEISRETPPYWSQTVEHNPVGGPLYGLTFRWANGGRLDPDPSTCVRSAEEVETYLAEVTTCR